MGGTVTPPRDRRHSTHFTLLTALSNIEYPVGMNQIDVVKQAFGLVHDADVARLLGVCFQAVGAWRKRGTIPPARRWQIVELSIERSVPLPAEFWPANQPPKSEAA